MTKSIRRVHDANFKTKVVLEALKGVKTLAQISSDFGIHAQQITDRDGGPVERQVLDGIPSIFESPTSKPILNIEQREQIENPLFQQIGQLKVENDWLKKKLRTS